MFIVAIPKYTKGKLPLVPKNKSGAPLASRSDALAIPRDSTPDLLPPPGSVDKGSVATVTEKGTVREVKEWQAIMDYLRDLPRANPRELPVIAVEGRAAETRSFKAKT
jgi:5'-nucleotidase